MSIKKGDQCYWHGVLVEVVSLHTAIIVRLLSDYSDSRRQRLKAGSELNVGRNPEDLDVLKKIEPVEDNTFFVMNDPSMLLCEWQDAVNHLIDQYGPAATMYTDGGANNVELFVKRDS